MDTDDGILWEHGRTLALDGWMVGVAEEEEEILEHREKREKFNHCSEWTRIAQSSSASSSSSPAMASFLNGYCGWSLVDFLSQSPFRVSLC